MPKKLTQEEWIAKARAVHGDRYGYELVEYRVKTEKVTIVCKEHGPFRQEARLHIKGQGCRFCGRLLAASKHNNTTESFVAQAVQVHGDRYDYSEVVYEKAKKKVTVRCGLHGDWEVTPTNHLSGFGCPACRNLKIAAERTADRDRFLVLARSVHGDRYCYNESLYTDRRSRLEIKCKTHGVFTQTPDQHYRGHGCTACSHSGPSKFETEIMEYVLTLCPDAVGNDRTVIKPKELDVYVPSANLAIECNGVHFHSDRYKNKNDHRDKMLATKAAGVRLIQVTDDDWKRRRPQLERMIRNALGKSQDVKIPARKCVAQQITTREAQAFLDQWHPQGKGSSRVTCFGLFHPGHGLCAVMTFAKDAYRRNPQGVTKGEHWGKYSLCRYTTSANVQGGASKLFKHVVKALELDEVDSFSSNDWFGGKLYETLGFHVVEEITPDYRVYHPKTGLRGKSTWRRTNIPARLKEIGSDVIFDPETDRRTEWMLEDEVGAKRIWDSGKIRWIWKATNQ